MNGLHEDTLSSIAEDIDDVDFPYENLVLEGGGSQGNAYIGAIMVRCVYCIPNSITTSTSTSTTIRFPIHLKTFFNQCHYLSYSFILFRPKTS